MVKGPLEFEESQLGNLYPSGEFGSLPVLQLDSGKSFSVNDVRSALLKQEPALCVPKSERIMGQLQRALPNNNETLPEALAKLPKSLITLCVQVLRLVDVPGVKYTSASATATSYYPPRFTIDLTHPNMVPKDLETQTPNALYYATAGRSFRINTGHALRITQLIQKRTLLSSGGLTKLTKSRTPEAQQDFIVMPRVRCNKDARIHVSDCPVDPDNTGLFCVNFVVLSGQVRTLEVTLRAYVADMDRAAGNLVDPEPGSKPFKPKDMRATRLVCNPSVKLAFETLRRDEAGKYLIRTFNSKTEPRTLNERETLVFSPHVMLLMVSRKREWMETHVVTISGLNCTVRPQVFCDDPKNLKNHLGLARIMGYRTKLFDEYSVVKGEVRAADMTRPLKIINGSFYNIPGYASISKASAQLSMCIAALVTGARVSAQMTNSMRLRHPQVNLEDLMRIYDYQRTISPDEPKVLELMSKSDRELWDSRSNSQVGAYSVSLMWAFKSLVGHLFRDKLTRDELMSIGFNDTAEATTAAAAALSSTASAASSDAGKPSTQATASTPAAALSRAASAASSDAGKPSTQTTTVTPAAVDATASSPDSGAGKPSTQTTTVTPAAVDAAAASPDSGAGKPSAVTVSTLAAVDATASSPDSGAGKPSAVTVSTLASVDATASSPDSGAAASARPPPKALPTGDGAAVPPRPSASAALSTKATPLESLAQAASLVDEDPTSPNASAKRSAETPDPHAPEPKRYRSDEH